MHGVGHRLEDDTVLPEAVHAVPGLVGEEALGESNPSQGGQYYRVTPLEEGVAQAHGPTICEAPLYAAAGSGTGLWPHFMQCCSLD